MKKKAILGFMTGAAIVAATTGSYAAWDKLSDSKTATVTLRKPVVVTTNLQDVTSSEDIDSGDPTYTVPITVKAADLPENANVSWQFTTSLKDGSTDVAADIVIDGTTDNKASVNTTDSNGQTFNVKVTPSDATDTNVAGKSLTLEVKAELVK